MPPRPSDAWLAAPPDKILALVAQMDDPAAGLTGAGPVTYACPMHPEIINEEPARCPKCGMKLFANTQPTADHDATTHHHEAAMDHEAATMHHGAHHDPDEAHDAADGIEWEDDMVAVNRLTTSATMHWSFRDRTAGADSPAIDWRFRVGERVKIRPDGRHPVPTSPTRGSGWPTAISPSTCRAA